MANLPRSPQLQAFARTDISQQQEWTVTLAECPQQSNSYECGIDVTINAFSVTARMSLPATYNGNAWRLICSCLLHSVVEDDKLGFLTGITVQGNAIDPSLNGPRKTFSNESTICNLHSIVQDTKTHDKKLRTTLTWLLSFQSSAYKILKLLGLLDEPVLQKRNCITKKLAQYEARR